MDNSVESIVRDAKIMAISVIALLGGGALLLLFVTAFPKISFFATVLLGISALVILLLTK